MDNKEFDEIFNSPEVEQRIAPNSKENDVSITPAPSGVIEIDNTERSNCCDALFIENTDFCSKCGEHSYEARLPKCKKENEA